MLDATKQSDAIVRSLFPDAVADKLYEEARKKEIEKSKNVVLESKNKQLRSFMKSPTLISESNDGDVFTEAAPIAELFTDTTILFADFVGTLHHHRPIFIHHKITQNLNHQALLRGARKENLYRYSPCLKRFIVPWTK